MTGRHSEAEASAEGAHLVDGRLAERRRNMRIRRFMAEAATFLFVAMMVMSPVLAKEMPVPEKPSLYVKDDAGVLNVEQKDDLDEMLKKYDKETGNQIAVLLIRTTGDESIEKYSYRVATAWGVGQKGKDNGILITIATEDRKDRIEVGKGLESEVTDSRAGRILRTREVTRSFRRKRWNDGIRSIISQLQECISTKGKSVDRDAFFDGMLTRSVFFVFAGVVLWIAVVRNLKLIAKKSTGGTAGILPWIGRAGGAVSAGTVIFGPAKALIPLFATTFFIYMAIAIYADAIGAIPHSGSSSSGGWSSGSGSSSGSSFGGGSFGGGGASGGW